MVLVSNIFYFRFDDIIPKSWKHAKLTRQRPKANKPINIDDVIKDIKTEPVVEKCVCRKISNISVASVESIQSTKSSCNCKSCVPEFEYNCDNCGHKDVINEHDMLESALSVTDIIDIFTQDLERVEAKKIKAHRVRRMFTPTRLQKVESKASLASVNSVASIDSKFSRVCLNDETPDHDYVIEHL